MVDWLGSPNDTNYTAHTYSPDHLYLYSVTGQGVSVAFNLGDSLYSDNSGILQVTLTATPEPGSLAMLSLGAVVMLKRRRICR